MKEWIKELCPEIADWQAELIVEHCQAKREWVSLTKQEINVEALKDDYAAYFALGAIWADKKLREKNGC